MPPSDNNSDRPAPTSKRHSALQIARSDFLVAAAVAVVAIALSSLFFGPMFVARLQLPRDVDDPAPPPRATLQHVIPRTLQEEETQTAYLAISREADAVLFKKLPQGAKLERHEIDVGSSMIVDLKASPPAAFTITRLAEREQILPEFGFARWEWDLVSYSPGNHELILSVSLVLKDEFGNKDRRTVEVYRQAVTVTVLPIHKRALRFAQEEWKWIIGTVVTLLALWIAYRQWVAPKQKA